MHYAVACRSPRCLAYAVCRNGRKDAHHYTCYAPCLQLACPSWCDQLVMPVDPFLGSIAVIATVDLVQLLLALAFRTKTNVRLMSWQINPLIGLLFHKLVYSYSISIFAKLYACKPNNPYNICVCPRCFSIELILGEQGRSTVDMSSAVTTLSLQSSQFRPARLHLSRFQHGIEAAGRFMMLASSAQQARTWAQPI